MCAKRSFQIATAFGTAIASYAWIMYYGQKKCIYVPPTLPDRDYDLSVCKSFYISGLDRPNDDGTRGQDILQSFCMEGDSVTLTQAPEDTRPMRIAIYLSNGLHLNPLRLGFLPRFAEKDIYPFLNFGGDVRGHIKNIAPINNTDLLRCEIELELLYHSRVI